MDRTPAASPQNAVSLPSKMTAVALRPSRITLAAPRREGAVPVTEDGFRWQKYWRTAPLVNSGFQLHSPTNTDLPQRPKQITVGLREGARGKGEPTESNETADLSSQFSTTKGRFPGISYPLNHDTVPMRWLETAPDILKQFVLAKYEFAKPNTLYGLAATFAVECDWDLTNLENINACHEAMRQKVRDRIWKMTTYNKHVRVVRRYIRWLLRDDPVKGHGYSNVVEIIKGDIEEEEDDERTRLSFTWPEIAKASRNNQVVLCFLTLMAETGCNAAEIIWLKFQDIEFRLDGVLILHIGARAEVRKNKYRNRWLPLDRGSKSYKRLRYYLDTSDRIFKRGEYLFLSKKTGKRYKNPASTVNYYLKKAGLKISTHSFRKLMGSRLRKQRWERHLADMWMGWKEFGTFRDHYSTLSPDEQIDLLLITWREKNAEAEAEEAKRDRCPQCQLLLLPGDTICGNCGRSEMDELRDQLVEQRTMFEDQIAQQTTLINQLIKHVQHGGHSPGSAAAEAVTEAEIEEE